MKHRFIEYVSQLLDEASNPYFKAKDEPKDTDNGIFSFLIGTHSGPKDSKYLDKIFQYEGSYKDAKKKAIEKAKKAGEKELSYVKP
ncbi:MAG TPA: hypothetical protein PLA71_00845 [Saccharofermentans sp.]|nr:hypothetical protein [Saccharofermentans sp.]